LSGDDEEPPPRKHRRPLRVGRRSREQAPAKMTERRQAERVEARGECVVESTTRLSGAVANIRHADRPAEALLAEPSHTIDDRQGAVAHAKNRANGVKGR